MPVSLSREGTPIVLFVIIVEDGHQIFTTFPNGKCHDSPVGHVLIISFPLAAKKIFFVK